MTGAALRLSDGREMALPSLEIGEEGYYDRIEQVSWRRNKTDGYYLEDANNILYYFNAPQNREGYRMLLEIKTRSGFRIQFKYDPSGSGYPTAV